MSWRDRATPVVQDEPPRVEDFGDGQVQPPPGRERKGGAEAAGLGFTQGTSFGFGDELAGAFAAGEAQKRAMLQKALGGLGLSERFAARLGGALVPLAPYEDTKDPGKVYTSVRDIARRENKQAQEDQPLPYLAGEIGGGLATPVPGAGGARTGAQTATASGRVLKSLGRGALAGGVAGGVSGAGHAEGDLSEAINQTLGGAVGGMALGGALGGGFQAGAEGLRAVGGKAREVATKALGELAPEVSKRFVRRAEEFVKPGKDWYQALLKKTREGLDWRRETEDVAAKNRRAMQEARAEYIAKEDALREKAAQKMVSGDEAARAEAAAREDQLVSKLRKELDRQQRGEDRSKEISALLEESRAIREAAPKKGAQEVSTYAGTRRNRADYLRGAGQEDFSQQEQEFLDALDAFNRQKFAEEAAQGFDPAGVMARATEREMGRAAALESKASELATRPQRPVADLINELVGGAKAGTQSEDELARAIREALRREGVTQDPSSLPVRSVEEALAEAGRTVFGGRARLPRLLPKPAGQDPFLPPQPRSPPPAKFKAQEPQPPAGPIPGAEPWPASMPDIKTQAPAAPPPQAGGTVGGGVTPEAAARRAARRNRQVSPVAPPEDRLPTPEQLASDEALSALGWPARLRPELVPPKPPVSTTPVSRIDIEQQLVGEGRQALRDQGLKGALDAVLSRDPVGGLARASGMGVAREVARNPAARAAAFGDIAKVLERVPGAAERYGPILEQAAARGGNALAATWHAIQQRDEALRQAIQEGEYDI